MLYHAKSITCIVSTQIDQLMNILLLFVTFCLYLPNLSDLLVMETIFILAKPGTIFILAKLTFLY